jgi:DNA-binding CsgD family transcriptional regulator
MAEAAFVAGQAGRLDVTVELASLQPDSTSITGRVNSAMTAGYVGLYLEGDVATGHRRLVAALRDAETLDDATLTRAVNVLLAITQYAGDSATWAETDALVDGVAQRLDPLSLLYRDAWGDFAYRGATVGRRLADQLARLPELAPWDVMRLSVAAFYAGVLADFRSAIRELFDREQTDGVVTNAMTMLHMLLLDQMDTGQWEQAEETGRRGLALTAAHRHDTYEQHFRVFLAVLAASKGESARARELAATVAAWARPRGLGLLVGYCRRAMVLSALADGDYAAAYAVATEIAGPGVIPHYSQQALVTLMDLVEAAVHTDRVDAARRHVAAALALGLPDLSPRLALLCAGAAAMCAGSADASEAERLFAEAVAHPAAARFPFEHARIQLAHGMWLRRQRRYRDAAPILEAARSALEHLGSAPWAARAAAELRAAGATVQRLKGEELSAQERRIAELAAAGLSNKEIADRLFLSPRTVGAHLYRVFPKLGIARRSGLRQALDELGGST